MDELVKLVSEKAGIPEESARQAVETVIGFLKERLPAPIAGQIDGILQNVDFGQAGNLLSGLGGLFGKR